MTAVNGQKNSLKNVLIFETPKNLILSLVGLSSAEPFWKYDRPERFVKWATEAIPQIISEGVRIGLATTKMFN